MVSLGDSLGAGVEDDHDHEIEKEAPNCARGQRTAGCGPPRLCCAIQKTRQPAQRNTAVRAETGAIQTQTRTASLF